MHPLLKSLTQSAHSVMGTMIGLLDTEESNTLTRSYSDVATGVCVRIFCIWNARYASRMFFAVNFPEAVRLCREVKHTHTARYRKRLDMTDQFLADDPHGHHAAALAAGRSGVAEYSADTGWVIAGAPVE